MELDVSKLRFKCLGLEAVSTHTHSLTQAWQVTSKLEAV